MKFLSKLIFALFALVTMTYTVIAVAESDSYTPLQVQHAGIWADLENNGQGIELVPFDTPTGRQVFAIYFAADDWNTQVVTGPNGQPYAQTTFDPVWYSGAGDVTREGVVIPLRVMATYAGLRNFAWTPLPPAVATLKLSNVACDTMDGSIVWDANSPGYNQWTGPLGSVSYKLRRLNPDARQCYTCPNTDFSPPRPGCGF